MLRTDTDETGILSAKLRPCFDWFGFVKPQAPLDAAPAGSGFLTVQNAVETLIGHN
jgi:hypothetical protein